MNTHSGINNNIKLYRLYLNEKRLQNIISFVEIAENLQIKEIYSQFMHLISPKSFGFRFNNKKTTQ